MGLGLESGGITLARSVRVHLVEQPSGSLGDGSLPGDSVMFAAGAGLGYTPK